MMRNWLVGSTGLKLRSLILETRVRQVYTIKYEFPDINKLRKLKDM